MSGQLDLFAADAPPIDGHTYDPAADGRRLGGQLARVLALMTDGRWRTLAEIAAAAGGSEAGVSARLRDLRKPKFGRHAVEGRRRGDTKAGLWEYRVVVPVSVERKVTEG